MFVQAADQQDTPAILIYEALLVARPHSEDHRRQSNHRIAVLSRLQATVQRILLPQPSHRFSRSPLVSSSPRKVSGLAAPAPRSTSIAQAAEHPVRRSLLTCLSGFSRQPHLSSTNLAVEQHALLTERSSCPLELHSMKPCAACSLDSHDLCVIVRNVDCTLHRRIESHTSRTLLPISSVPSEETYSP